MHRKADGGSVPWNFRKFLKPWDMSHKDVITSISDVFIPECIMLCEATQRYPGNPEFSQEHNLNLLSKSLLEENVFFIGILGKSQILMRG